MPYLSLSQKAFVELLERLVDEVRQIAAQAGEDYIRDLNSDLAAAQPGDKLLGFTVTAHTGNRIEFQRQESFKYGSVKFRFFMDDQLDFGPKYVNNPELRALLGELRISKPQSYEAIVGYAFDHGPPAYESARAKIALANPDFSIDAFLAGSPDGGFIVDFGIGTNNPGASGFPLVIPLGPTGFALQGFGGTFADNFRPNLVPGGGPEPSPITAVNYVEWAQSQSAKPLDGWRPTNQGEGSAGGIGLRTDIIDLATSGALIRIKDAGFLALSDGPVVVHGGRGRLLSLPPDKFRFDSISALDFRSLSYAVQGGAALKLPGDDSDWELLACEGAITAQISLKDSRAWFYNIGTDAAPIQGRFLTDVISASVFFMANFERIYVGAHVNFGGREIDFFGIRIEAYFGMDSRAKLGFQPIHYYGSLTLFGGIGIRIWKFKLGVEISGVVILAVLQPLQLKLSVDWKISLPWPLSDISGTVTLVDVYRPQVPEIAKPILLAKATKSGQFGGLAEGPTQKLGALHTLTAVQFDVFEDNAKIWPDCELAIPFSRKLIDQTSKIFGPPVNSYRDGQITVRHQLDTLQLLRIKQDGKEEEITGLRGVWVVAPAQKDGQQNTGTSRLHFPANDPFRWLDQYQDSQIVTTPLKPDGIEVDFGIGASQYNQSKVVVTPVVVSRLSAVGIDVVDDAAFQLPTRVARLRNITLQIVEEDGAFRLVSKAVLTFVSYVRADFEQLTSNKALRIAAISSSSAEGRPELYFARIEITDPTGLNFSDFEIRFGKGGDCALGWKNFDNRACVSTISLYKICYFGPKSASDSWIEKTILQPGVYRLRATGSSTWSAPGASKSGAWDFNQKFNVITPPILSPYIAHVTIGDERKYGIRGQKLWNPTPVGLGFPRYTNHLSSVVFRPDYLSKIFSALTVTYTSAGLPPQAVTVTKSENQERFESASSAKWALDAGGQYGVADEMLFDAPEPAGVDELAISFHNPLDNKVTTIERWAFETARFATPNQHLRPARPSVSIARSLTSQQVAPAAVDAAATLDTSTITKPPYTPQTIPPQWRLPPGYVPRLSPFEPQASLDFLRFIQHTSIPISRVTSDPLRGITERPSQTEVHSFIDNSERAFAFWLRTPQPFDWRRLKAGAAVYSLTDGPGPIALKDEAPLAIELQFIPSIDGSAALMLGKAGATFIRLPAGLYVIQQKFALKAPNLPHLRQKSATTQSEIAFATRLVNAFGRSFGTP